MRKSIEANTARQVDIQIDWQRNKNKPRTEKEERDHYKASLRRKIQDTGSGKE